MGKVSLKVLEKFLNCLLKKGWEPCVRECLQGSFPFFSSPLKIFFLSWIFLLCSTIWTPGTGYEHLVSMESERLPSYMYVRQVWKSGGGRGGWLKPLPIHSLKWNQNDVLTTCKVVIKGLASGIVYWSCALRYKHDSINGPLLGVVG